MDVQPGAELHVCRCQRFVFDDVFGNLAECERHRREDENARDERQAAETWCLGCLTHSDQLVTPRCEAESRLFISHNFSFQISHFAIDLDGSFSTARKEGKFEMENPASEKINGRCPPNFGPSLRSYRESAP